jgi:predicted nucleic acid-binding protein
VICTIDASAAIGIALKRDDAIDFVNQILAADKVIAPKLFYAEVGNAIHKYVQGGFFDEEQGLDLYQTAIQTVDEFVDIETLIEEAFHESIRLKHDIYDMLYLVLARRRGAKLLTLDKKLQELYNTTLS